MADGCLPSRRMSADGDCFSAWSITLGYYCPPTERSELLRFHMAGTGRRLRERVELAAYLGIAAAKAVEIRTTPMRACEVRERKPRVPQRQAPRASAHADRHSQGRCRSGRPKATPGLTSRTATSADEFVPFSSPILVSQFGANAQLVSRFAARIASWWAFEAEPPKRPAGRSLRSSARPAWSSRGAQCRRSPTAGLQNPAARPLRGSMRTLREPHYCVSTGP